jgi:hypothetical protein
MYVISSRLHMLRTFLGIGTHYFPILISLGRMQRIGSWYHSHSIIYRSTRYPLLLGGQRQCRFKARPLLLYVTVAGNRTTDPSISGQTPQPWGHFATTISMLSAITYGNDTELQLNTMLISKDILFYPGHNYILQTIYWLAKIW